MRLPVTIYSEIKNDTIIHTTETIYLAGAPLQIVTVDNVPIGAWGYIVNDGGRAYIVYKQVIRKEI